MTKKSTHHPKDWIEEYKTEDGLQYSIPSYKVSRIYALQDRIEELEAELKQYQGKPKVGQHKVQITEYDEGVQRDEGVKYFDSYEAAQAFIKDYNKENNKAQVPAWYMAASYAGVVK